MTVRGFLFYSLLTNAVLIGAVLWQDRVRVEALEVQESAARDNNVVFREHVVRELASDDPARIDGVQALCQAELDRLKPLTMNIWDR